MGNCRCRGVDPMKTDENRSKNLRHAAMERRAALHEVWSRHGGDLHGFRRLVEDLGLRLASEDEEKQKEVFQQRLAT